MDNLVPKTDKSATYAELLKASHITKHLLKSIDVKNPTLLQKAAIPLILENQNCVLQYSSPAGVKLSYLIPLIHKALEGKKVELDQSEFKYLSVIICATKARCEQVNQVLTHLIESLEGVLESTLALEPTVEAIYDLLGNKNRKDK